MYDAWHGTDEWEPSPPQQTYIILAAHDMYWDDDAVLRGASIWCHICKQIDRWVPEETNGSIVWICEHEPVSVGRGMIRQISSVHQRDVSGAFKV